MFRVREQTNRTISSSRGRGSGIPPDTAGATASSSNGGARAVAVTETAARAWLRRAAEGYCDTTDEGNADCRTASKGTFPLAEASYRSWPRATAHCLQACERLLLAITLYGVVDRGGHDATTKHVDRECGAIAAPGEHARDGAAELRIMNRIAGTGIEGAFFPLKYGTTYNKVSGTVGRLLKF